MTYEEMLIEFHEKYNHTINVTPTVPERLVCELRYKLIEEEVFEELLDSLSKCMNGQNDLINLADAIADSIYVIIGTAVSFGIPIDKVFAEVHRSNMTKSMLKDEKSIKGKTLKGPDFEPPRIKEIMGL